MPTPPGPHAEGSHTPGIGVLHILNFCGFDVRAVILRRPQFFISLFTAAAGSTSV
jgi:hypothetical protein